MSWTILVIPAIVALALFIFSRSRGLPRRVRRTPFLVAGLFLGLMITPVAFTAATASTSTDYRATLQAVPLNPASSGYATISRVGTQVTVDVHATGLTPNLPHAMHIHGDLKAQNECPLASADINTGDPISGPFIAGTPDGLISVSEGAPFYGPVQVSFTLDPFPTTAAVAFEVEKFPTANPSGVLDYHRTFTIPGKVVAKLGQLHVVVHGEDLNASGSYDSFMEASLPVACGRINPS